MTCDLLDNFGETVFRQERLKEAEELFRRALELTRKIRGEDHPRTLASLKRLMHVLVKQGKPDEARTYATKLIRSGRRAAEQPDAEASNLNAYAWSLLNCVPEDLRDPHAALPVAKRAMELTDGKNPENLDTLALAYFMTGDTAKSIETQEKAVAQLPQDAPGRAEYEANLAKYRRAAKN